MPSLISSCNDAVYFEIFLMKLQIGVHNIGPLWEKRIFILMITQSIRSNIISRYIRDYKDAAVNQRKVVNIITEVASGFF